MKSTRVRSLSPWLFAPALLWVLLYFFRLPTTVQSGDSGEFVTASELLTVAHPPGYPLFVWYLKLGRALLPVGSPYWQAAFLTSILSMLTLGFLFFLHPKHRILAGLSAATLAVSSVFWKYSLLPDVFALHWLLLSALLFVFVNPRIKSERSRLYWMSALLGLGFANHLTTAFLAPLWIYQAARVRNLKAATLSALMGASITAIFYLSLGLFDRRHYLSWGYIQDFNGILHHFLRSDYGSFSLSAARNRSFYADYLILFSRHFFTEFLLVVFAVIGFGWLRRFKKGQSRDLSLNARRIAIALSVLLYVGPFFMMFNIGPYGFGYDVFERFLGMPVILLLGMGILSVPDENIRNFLARHRLNASRKTTAIFAAVTAVSMASGWHNNARRLDYTSRVLIEEFAKNLVSRRPFDPRKPTLVTAMSDTSLFALSYVLGVLKSEPNVYVITPIGFELEWNRKRLLHQFPTLQFRPTQNGRYFLADFIRDNAGQFNFLVEQDVADAEFAYEFHPVGRFVSLGKGVTFKTPEESPLKRSADWSAPFVRDYNEYDPDLEAYSRYSHYYLARGMSFYQKGDLRAALASFDEGLREVPYCQPCLANKCRILESLHETMAANACTAVLKRLMDNYFVYYSGSGS